MEDVSEREEEWWSVRLLGARGRPTPPIRQLHIGLHERGGADLEDPGRAAVVGEDDVVRLRAGAWWRAR